MLTPTYLAEILPCMRRDLSQFSLRFDGNFSLLRCRTAKCYGSFIPPAVKLWNDLSLDIRNSQSLIIFKPNLCQFLFPFKYNILFNYSINARRPSMLHIRLRQDHCALNDYLFKINCKASPRCSCGFEMNL